MIKTKVYSTSSKAKVSRVYNQRLKQVIAVAGQDVRNHAVQSIHQHGSSGETYEKYSPRRTHTAAVTGNPPNTDTGYLANNIFLEIKNNGLTAEVQSRAEYSGYLELGYTTKTGKFVQFPFLQPALEQVRPKLKRMLKRLKGGA